jgi:cytochrome c
MTRHVLLAAVVGGLWAGGVLAQGQRPERFGLGRPATDAEIRALDIDVRPDGAGLPPGRGTVVEGEALYVPKCAACHGMKGEGLTADRLVGRTPGDRFTFATSADPKTVGSYWPYATTLFDYTRRAMPHNGPGSLAADEVYALVAYLLFLNDIVPADAVMDASSLPQVRIPARDRFVPDDRSGGPVVR